MARKWFEVELLSDMLLISKIRYAVVNNAQDNITNESFRREPSSDIWHILN